MLSRHTFASTTRHSNVQSFLLTIVVVLALLTTVQCRMVPRPASSASSPSPSFSSSLDQDQTEAEVGDQDEKLSPVVVSLSSSDSQSKGSEEESIDEDEDDYDDDKDYACPPKHFYDLEKEKCTQCSICPSDHYGRRMCNKFQDTLCYPLYKPGSSPVQDPPQNRDWPWRNQNSAKKPSSEDADVKPVSEKKINKWQFVSFILLVLVTVIFACFLSVLALLRFYKIRALRAKGKEIVIEYSPVQKPEDA